MSGDGSGRFGGLFYWFLRGVAWLLTRLVCRYRIYGRDNVPGSGSLLVVANHLSWYDPILMGVVLPRRIWFFGKVEVFTWPVVGWLSRVTGQIPVNRGERDRTAIETALAYLREERAVIFFPEGTLERQEQMIAAHNGAAMLALRSGAMLLPVAHTGTRRILRSGKGWFPRVNVQIGSAYKPVLPEGVTRKVGLQLITQEIMEHVAEMLPAEQRGVYKKDQAFISEQ
jgi:1-acyl-sn-glycerol-3-phosphate acyltransferase